MQPTKNSNNTEVEKTKESTFFQSPLEYLVRKIKMIANYIIYSFFSFCNLFLSKSHREIKQIDQYTTETNQDTITKIINAMKDLENAKQYGNKQPEYRELLLEIYIKYVNIIDETMVACIENKMSNSETPIHDKQKLINFLKIVYKEIIYLDNEIDNYVRGNDEKEDGKNFDNALKNVDYLYNLYVHRIYIYITKNPQSEQKLLKKADTIPDLHYTVHETNTMNATDLLVCIRKILYPSVIPDYYQYFN